MVLAAGRGLRLRPLTEHTPKPLVRVAGRALIDYALDLLIATGVREIVVNAHHLAEQIERHMTDVARQHPALTLRVSREVDLLETGGGVLQALPWLGAEPFFVLNSDVIVRDGPSPTLARMAQRFDARSMDALLLLQPVDRALGYDGAGDYSIDHEGRLASRGERAAAPFVFTGTQILAPRLFSGERSGAFSLKRLYDHAESAGRLFGLVHDGAWLHVGTPAALADAEQALRSES